MENQKIQEATEKEETNVKREISEGDETCHICSKIVDKKNVPSVKRSSI